VRLRRKLAEIDLKGNSTEAFGLGLKSVLDSVLLFGSQGAVAQFVSTNLETAHSGDP